MRTLAERARMVVSFDAISFILGLGYVMGLRSSMILCAGGVLSNLVLVPLIWFIGSHIDVRRLSGHHAHRGHDRRADLSRLRALHRRRRHRHRRHLRHHEVPARRRRLLRHRARAPSAAAKPRDAERTDRDISVLAILLGVVVGAIGVAHLARATSGSPAPSSSLGLALTLLFSFFFTSVAANAIATTARNPVSGMTMLTIIISSVVLLRFGLSGTTGMFFVMAIAGMVCTALSVSGQAITDLKTGYWLGSTPAAQEKVKFLGVIAAAVAVGLTIVILARTFQFGEAAPGDLRVVLASPQASIMKALVEGFMSRQPVAYMLFGVGAVIAVIMEMLGKPALIFALGMYLPLELNTPALVGGFLSHFLGQALGEDRRRARLAHPRARRDYRLGLMAGGALGGVLGAALPPVPRIPRRLDQDAVLRERARLAIRLRAVVCRALCVYLWFGSLEVKEKEASNGLRLRNIVANAILGIDTLWGGDVMCASGTGRFIADSWFSDEPLPAAYTHPAAARAARIRRRRRQSARPRRPSRHISAPSIFPPPSPASAAKRKARRPARRLSRRPRALASKPCATSPWRSSAKAIPCPTRAASKPPPAKPPEPSDPQAKRERVAELLGRAGYPRAIGGELLAAVDAWRSDRVVPMASVRALGAAVIAHFDALSAANLLPYLPAELPPCPAPTSSSCPSRTPGSPAP